jgi:hypothetical protein
MTNEVLAVIKQVGALPLGWQLENGQDLRTAGEDRCPLTALSEARTGSRFEIYDYHLAGRALGLSRRTIDAIMRATDNLLKGTLIRDRRCEH